MAVSLSGGGFRATLSGLGVLRLLADAGLLAQVRHASSVSGGSVANGLFAYAYPALTRAGFSADAFDEHVLQPAVRVISEQSLSRGMLRRAWKIIGRRTRTHLLADEFDRHFFHGQLLEELASDCRFVFNASNTTTGVRFGFERELVGDYVIGRVPTSGTRLRMATAVAASAALPGALAPLVLTGIDFPCLDGRTVRLVDGGVYDNMGLEPVDHLRDNLLVALNAGGLFQTGSYGKIPVVRDLQLAQSLLYRQSTALRRRWMVERFKAWEAAARQGDAPPEWGRRGVLFGLATTFTPAEDWRRANPSAPSPDDVAFIKTSFDKFPTTSCEQLVHAGWWLAGATLATYHRDVLPEMLPTWRPLP